MRKFADYKLGRAKVRLFERSAGDVISAAGIEDVNIVELSIILVRDSIKHNIKLWNPLSWRYLKYNLKGLYKLPKRVIFEMAKEVTEIEGGDANVYKYILGQMTEFEQKQYQESLKKKVMTITQ